jgi:hypothetical protein
MGGDRGQSARVVVRVVRVAIDVVVAVAKYDAAQRAHSSIIPRDHRMRDQ